MYKSVKKALVRKQSQRPQYGQDEMVQIGNTAKLSEKDFKDIQISSPKAKLWDEYSSCSSLFSFSSETTLGDPEPLGLHLLYPTARQLKTQSFEYESKLDEIDIVAIHDLGGPYRSSWTHENGTLWLRDLLPETFPRARVFSFGYQPEVFFTDRESEVGVRACADELLQSLKEVRVEKEAERPIVFICHGLGGIVCKQALLTASHRVGNSALVAATRAAIFLGTPHRGFSSHKFAGLFAEILPLGVYLAETKCIFESRHEMLQDAFKTVAAMVRGINSSFKKAGIELNLFSCYDTSYELRECTISSHASSETIMVKSSLSSLYSAIIGVKREDYLPLNTDYLNMGRFSRETDPNYRMLVHILWQTVTRKAGARGCNSSTHGSRSPSCSDSGSQELLLSPGLEYYDHCELVQDEIKKKQGYEPRDSTRRRVAKRILVAAGHGHKDLPHLRMPHHPVRDIFAPDSQSAARLLNLSLHRPTLRKHKPDVKPNKPSVEDDKQMLHILGPRGFRFADGFDPEYSANRIYIRHHAPKIVKTKSPVALQSAHDGSERNIHTPGLRR